MAETGWTPGSWVFQDDEFIVAGAWPYGSTICTMDEKNRKANARLIAAAPDMAEALEAIVGHYAGDEGLDRAMKEGIDAEILAARTALARARGQEQEKT